MRAALVQFTALGAQNRFSDAVRTDGVSRRDRVRADPLCGLIIDGANQQEPVNLYFPGDDLFDPFRRRRGLPIGNLTSKFFANVYLDRLDHFVKEVLRAMGYVRGVVLRRVSDRARNRKTRAS